MYARVYVNSWQSRPEKDDSSPLACERDATMADSLYNTHTFASLSNVIIAQIFLSSHPQFTSLLLNAMYT